MPFRICIDAGNTLIKMGVFNDNESIIFKSFASQEKQQLIEYINSYPNSDIIYSGVRNDLDFLEEYLKQKNALFLNSEVKLPFQNLYQNPQKLGTDRIALVCGAIYLKNKQLINPEKLSLIIGIGTCITYDILTADQKYFGGAISPGPEMRLKAMNHYTGKLPLPEFKINNDFPANDTESNLLTGVYRGIIHEIDGFINDLKLNHPYINCVITGGYAGFFENNLKNPIFAQENLALIGLNQILIYNSTKNDL